MGIEVEFNPDLALRNIRHYRKGSRSLEECIPENLEVGRDYKFLKEGQRNYWLEGEIPLLETEGYGRVSRPIASIKILEATHFVKINYSESNEGLDVEQRRICTKGKYRVVEIFDPNDKTPKFDGFARRK